jgi:hypothetical protein
MSNSKDIRAIGKHFISTLTTPEELEAWLQEVQDYFFFSFQNANMASITRRMMLDQLYFEASADFVDLLAVAVAHNEEEETENKPFDYDDVVDKCFEHSLDTGEGFKKWVYRAFFEVKRSLSKVVRTQTASVKRGDIIALLAAVKVAMHKSEDFTYHELEVEWAKCTMDTEGNNDIMTYISALASYIRRLTVAGAEPSTEKKVAVLLKGLN